jgi:hypothetical protein
MNAVTKKDSADIMEQVIIKGDLSKLTPQERTSYYMKVCDSIGLNPLTKPFEYINLNGKLQLYALKACTEQLRGIHGVSVTDLAETMHEGVFIVTAKVVNKEGRTDAAKGAVPLAGLKGEALANAMMKAETKAKRRATLSLCGLGWLDESEIESIPGAQVVPGGGAAPIETAVKAVEVKVEGPVPEQAKSDPRAKPTDEEIHHVRSVYASVKKMVMDAKDIQDIDDSIEANKKGLAELRRLSPTNADVLVKIIQQRRAELKPADFVDDDLPEQ